MITKQFLKAFPLIAALLLLGCDAENATEPLEAKSELSADEARAIRFEGKEALVVTSIGVAYLAVAGLGFVTSGNMLLGMIHINEADRWLHLGLAFAILLPGVLLRPTQRSINA